MKDNMKHFFKKYYVLIGFVLSFVLDAQYQILETLIKDNFWLNIVKGIGAILLAYFTGEKLKNVKNDTE